MTHAEAKAEDNERDYRMERAELLEETAGSRRRRALACRDRTCGALDCPTCRPWCYDESGDE